MATRQELIFDIITILTKSSFTDETRLDPDYIGYKIDEKRAKEIRDSYSRNQLIDPVWIQDYGIFDTTQVNYADDKTFTFLDCHLAKATLPQTVSFYNGLAALNNLGDYSFRSVSGTEEYFFKQDSKLKELLLDLPASHPLRKFGYYSKVGDARYFVSKNKELVPEKLRAMLILENPLDGFVFTTENVTSLTIGTSYTVVENQIVHNSIAYVVGSVFTAVNTTFTGIGKVQYTNQKRAMTNDDPYPFSKSQMEVVILKLLTQEYGIEASRVAEIRNNSQDDLKILSQPAI